MNDDYFDEIIRNGLEARKTLIEFSSKIMADHAALYDTNSSTLNKYGSRYVRTSKKVGNLEMRFTPRDIPKEVDTEYLPSSSNLSGKETKQ